MTCFQQKRNNTLDKIDFVVTKFQENACTQAECRSDILAFLLRMGNETKQNSHESR